MLVMRIKEYQMRYETETFNPELHGLLNDSVIFLGFVGKQLERLEGVELEYRKEQMRH